MNINKHVQESRRLSSWVLFMQGTLLLLALSIYLISHRNLWITVVIAIFFVYALIDHIRTVRETKRFLDAVEEHLDEMIGEGERDEVAQRRNARRNAGGD